MMSESQTNGEAPEPSPEVSTVDTEAITSPNEGAVSDANPNSDLDLDPDPDKDKDKDKDASAGPTSGSLYDMEKPKDVVDGLGRGVSNIAKGVFGGAALILFAPVAGAASGYQSGGTVGAMKGLGAGLCSGVAGGLAMAAGGVITGSAQIGRGIYHTPGAMSNSNAGMGNS